ncbi:amidase family protein [Virgibacillus necropolis]|uniref:Amidase n=1 Tax=Virgibacillus necropolis TaxID=163877 RepID=A0A221MHU1_9BACI|nr:amidase family protein [Virgibacillus necropolis]ASN07200.1 amidase [Virgibacillus necropolis]
MSKQLFQFNEATITNIQQSMESGELTALGLTKMYLEQIAKYNSTGPKINAVIEINPDALHIAEALDVERLQSGKRGPLHGVPILIKDNIDSGDKMHTTAGSVSLADHYASEDAFVTERLRVAGAIILGKTNLTEWANFMSQGMPNGYSSRGGQVLNPYGPGDFDVGGSSSGSGAGVAANFAAGAIGTETDGSILSPASSNSLVGIKPTVGLTSRTGIIPIAHSQDTAGPMTRTVEDAAILLGALSGKDAKDPATAVNADRITDYIPFLNKHGLENKRIGVPRNYLSELDETELTLVNQALEDMEKLGTTIVDPIYLPNDLPDSSVLYHEFKNGVNAYLGKLPVNSTVRSLRDVINFNQSNANEALEYGQTTLIKSETKSGALVEEEYITDRLMDLEFSQDKMQEVMREQKLDALFFPNFYGSSIAAKAGYPSITVPAGYTETGKPVGITFTGLAFSEAQLIELAYAYEQATNHRKAPVLE